MGVSTMRTLPAERARQTQKKLAAKQLKGRGTLELQNAELEARIAKLETRNAALTRFSFEAAHELMEPLVIAEGAAQLVIEELGRDLDPFLRRRLEAIGRVSADTRLLVEALVQDAGMSERSLEFRRLNLRDVVDDSMALVEQRVKSQGIDVVIGPLPTMRIAPQLLSIIVRNLLLNAVKYASRDKGKIRIQARRTGAEVRLSVASAGTPLEPALIERLFRPYERGEERRDEPGFGLGLAISSRVARRLGGRMGATSTRWGNTFFVVIPDTG